MEVFKETGEHDVSSERSPLCSEDRRWFCKQVMGPNARSVTVSHNDQAAQVIPSHFQKQTRSIQLRLTTAVNQKWWCHCSMDVRGRLRHPEDPWCRNRVFRRPLSDCQGSGDPFRPSLTLHDELITGRRGDEVWHGQTECTATTRRSYRVY